MKKYVIIAMVLVMAGGLFGCKQKEARVVTPAAADNEIVIYVDDVPIYWEQLQREAVRSAMQIPVDLPQEQREALTQRAIMQAIELLTTRVLVDEEMKRSGMIIPQEEVEAAKETLIQGISGDGATRSLAMLLAQAGMTLADLEHNLRLDVFKNRQILPRIETAKAELTDERLQEIYSENLQAFTRPAGRMVSHILFHLPEGADETVRAETAARAEAVRQRLLEGEDFAVVALEESDHVSRERGGVVGLIVRGAETPAVDEAIFSQEIGAIGEVVESPVGLHIILVTEELEEEVAPFEEAKDVIRTQVTRQLQEQITREYYMSLREKAQIRFVGRLAPQAPVAVEESAAAVEEEVPAAAE